jgi:5-methylcytosine-specific restriction endonuclease McrA
MTHITLAIDDLDTEIRRLCGDINAANYRLMLLIRQFDDRMGWARWSFRNCSEWLAWRSGITLSAARERVRTAQALRDLPQMSIAFAEGRLSYSKVRALTRAADRCNEEELVRYALNATATQVEERCRQIRNVRPVSAQEAQRAWERRSLSTWRNPARGTMTFSAELPLEAGELIAKALDRAVEAVDGQPLTVGRKQRTVPTALKRALWSRDRGCAFPGCQNTRFVDAHHVEHWSAGGETSLENLMLLCSHHHRLAHEGGFQIRRDHQEVWYFQRADGRVIPACGYRAVDAEPDPEELSGTNTSAEGFLAAVVKRAKPAWERTMRGG